MNSVPTQVARPCIAVVGNARLPPGDRRETIAFEIGRGLVDAGYRLVTGGLGGVMEAAHRGARASANWFEGAGIGILPGSDARQANPYVDIAIPTGLDHARNSVVAHSAAVIAVGGGAGTLSEMAFAWTYGRLVIGLRSGGWSERLAGQRIDDRVRYEDMPDDKVYAADGADEAIALIRSLLPGFSRAHQPIDHAPKRR